MKEIASILIALGVSLAPAALFAQGRPETIPEVPFEVRYAAWAAETILASPDGGVGLEAFDGDTITGVFLRGRFGGQEESVGYGLDPANRRYLWFSIDHGEHLDYVAMLFDVDADLTPDYLLFRVVDHKKRIEYATEYRAPNVRDVEFDITFQPVCSAPRCDPATWTVHPRQRVDVSAQWLGPWRPLFGIAASRGEAWIGKPVAFLRSPEPDADEEE